MESRTEKSRKRNLFDYFGLPPRRPWYRLFIHVRTRSLEPIMDTAACIMPSMQNTTANNTRNTFFRLSFDTRSSQKITYIIIAPSVIAKTPKTKSTSLAPPSRLHPKIHCPTKKTKHPTSSTQAINNNFDGNRSHPDIVAKQSIMNEKNIPIIITQAHLRLINYHTQKKN